MLSDARGIRPLCPVHPLFRKRRLTSWASSVREMILGKDIGVGRAAVSLFENYFQTLAKVLVTEFSGTISSFVLNIRQIARSELFRQFTSYILQLRNRFP